MTDPRPPAWSLAAALSLALAAAGCTPVASTVTSSLPDPVIVNDPSAVTHPVEPETAPLAVPIAEAPMHDELPPEPVMRGDVLDRIRAGLSLPLVDHQRVKREIEWLQRNPDYVARVFARAQRYLHHIANEVEARDLPADLALLPVVESAFNPFAYSRSDASGLWQFIAPTGDRYGLRRNYWQDQRRDVLESTRAALEYLADLHDDFDGDWYLAIAAYNYGSGNIRRAVRRNRASGRRTDFFSLSLPAETRAYVPKLIALAKIVTDPGAYGIYLPPIPDAPYFRVIPTDGPVDLRLMSDIGNLDSEELLDLNPSWNRWITDPDGPHRILVPALIADSFTTLLTALDGDARARLGVHTVADGDSVASIAGQYRVPETYIERLNAGQTTRLQPGDTLRVPTGDVSQLRAGLGSELEKRVHRVRSGESLWIISRKYGMSVSKLARLNGISTQAMLHPGQRLQVSGSRASVAEEPPVPVAASGKVNYKVKNGDTLSAIARRFEVTVRQLQAWNNMGRSTIVKVGQLLTVHVGGNTSVGG